MNVQPESRPSSELRVRAAPAPSGSLHVGNVRTFLFNWLQARHAAGSFVLRIEDTDKARFTEESYHAVLEDLRWLELGWDEGPQTGGPHAPYRQSERTSLYLDAASRLVNSGAAYRCYCTPEELEQRRREARARKRRPGYDGRCSTLGEDEIRRFQQEARPWAVRFRVPQDERIVFDDLVIGPVVTAPDQIDDFVLVRSDGTPLYHLSVVVDDALMRIHLIIRGDDLLSSTPKQILLHRALGNPVPKFAHVPQVLGPDRKPLSKRHGSTSIDEFRRSGYLPDALVNFLALLGWGTSQDTIMSRQELIARFDIRDVHPSPAMFDVKKLDWMNGEHIRMLDDARLARLVEPFFVRAGLVQDPPTAGQKARIAEVAPLVKTRMRRLDEAPGLVRGVFTDVEIDLEAARKSMAHEHVPELLRRAAERLAAVEPWSKEQVEATLRAAAGAMGLKPRTAFAPFYLAISGSPVSAPVFDLMALLGREECLRRLSRAEVLSRRLIGSEKV